MRLMYSVIEHGLSSDGKDWAEIRLQELKTGSVVHDLHGWVTTCMVIGVFPGEDMV